MERLTLSNAAFEGHNNAYLFDDGPETVLIDTGDWMAATRTQLTEALASHGVAMADIDRIFLTHWHPDHTGLAGEIQSQSGAEVYVHAEDAPLVEGDEDAWATLHETQERYFDDWGMPEPKQAVLRERMAEPTALDAPEVIPFADGDTFNVNGHELRVVHASGHAAGLCMFETTLDGSPVVFTGDALLPVYTPNVGGADVRVENPLEKYLRALRYIADAGYDRAWPGHRDPIADPPARAEHIIDHHEERAWRVLNVLDESGPLNTWEVSAELFGELSDIHILHGPGEAYAHLEHLAQTGAVIPEGETYRIAERASEALAEENDQRWELGF
ncbi:MBL fold metallo-hydrolase [Haloarchaeobius amylolyticus]|uniref:MBL fold metallo-hydrolase n=1 Tax=Haloarchaeobius amylolyticus TaxID=1198296 RepID=UPI00226F3020|nr:MBL fold metallo-hydrolase [Haloarchaeobius amylolyticus]